MISGGICIVIFILKIMHKLIKPIFRTLLLNKNKTADCLLIRHSVRFPIVNYKMAFDAGLTSNGVELAREFGRYLNWYKQPKRYFSSPVGRCIDTAINISQGANGHNNIVPDYRLSHSFIAGPLNKLSSYKVSQPMPEKIWSILQLLLADNAKGLTVAVTHDTVLVCLAAYLMGVVIESEEWPDYLEGIVFWKERDRFLLGWREKLFVFDQKNQPFND